MSVTSQTLPLADPFNIVDGDCYRDRAYREGDALVKRIELLLPRIAERAAETETLGHVPATSLAELSDAGLFRALTPLQFGGLEVDPASFFECVMKISAACPATGWVGGFYGVHAWQIALMDKRVQQEVWARSTDRGVASSYAPTGTVTSADGGFLLNGQWSFCSGIDGADWVILGGVIKDHSDGPAQRSFVVPKRDYTIVPDSWDVVGLAGSGSGSITLKDAFVPDYRTHRTLDVYQRTERGFEVNDRPLYQLSWLTMFYSTVAAVATGAARGAVTTFVDVTRTRVSAISGATLAQNGFLHLRIANALNAIDTLATRLPRRWRDAFDLACEGGESDLLCRKQLRFEGADAIAASFDAVSEIIEMGGGNVIERTHPVQRFFRDLLAIRNHPTAQREAFASIYIQHLLGVPSPEFTPAAQGMLLYYS
jgi:3-hydroxy-9,10-secoandrosta-1,3,5(10)-triene-9,17-dione monooxygenase